MLPFSLRLFEIRVVAGTAQVGIGGRIEGCGQHTTIPYTAVDYHYVDLRLGCGHTIYFDMLMLT